jgi:predicted DNA-binding transcriptional regulator AlpA
MDITNPKLLNREQTAKVLGLRPGTLALWLRLKKGPPVTRLGRLVRYDVEQLRAWLSEQTVQGEFIGSKGQTQ